jgi:uncharacterized protein
MTDTTNQQQQSDTAGRVERIPVEECWALLERAAIGRLAVQAPDGVDIYPVNIAVDHRRIVFRTNIGAKVLDLTIRPRVAIEIDGWTDARAWSVVIRGLASTPELMGDLRHLNGLELITWSPTKKTVYVEVTPDSVEGRRFDRVENRDPAWR